MADLLTLTEYKNYQGISLTDTGNDTQLTKMIAAASLAIRNYAGRDFTVGNTTEERTFEYDGGGYLDIDDCQAVTSVALSFTLGPDQTLDPTYQWRPKPFNAPTHGLAYYYLEIAGALPWGMDPELGFPQNLDTLAREGRLTAQMPVAKVTATWGWPAIPEDVKLALIWTLEGWGAGDAGPSTPGVVSESIEGFNRSFGGTGAAEAERTLLALPNRARDLLAQYQIINVG